jgi:hypothetical protein
VDFNTVSTVGLESSPGAAALGYLRGNESRRFKNKYDHVIAVEPASNADATIDWVHRILKRTRHRHLVSFSCVNGQQVLPVDGQQGCPLVANSVAHWRAGFVPPHVPIVRGRLSLKTVGFAPLTAGSGPIFCTLWDQSGRGSVGRADSGARSVRATG